jgi:hypothetical protein
MSRPSCNDGRSDVAGGAAAIPESIFDSSGPCPPSSPRMVEAPFRILPLPGPVRDGMVLFFITLRSTWWRTTFPTSSKVVLGNARPRPPSDTATSSRPSFRLERLSASSSPCPGGSWLHHRPRNQRPDWEFITQPPRGLDEGGIMPAIVGTLLLTVGASRWSCRWYRLGVYLTEYARQGLVIRSSDRHQLLQACRRGLPGSSDWLLRGHAEIRAPSSRLPDAGCLILAEPSSAPQKKP